MAQIFILKFISFQLIAKLYSGEMKIKNFIVKNKKQISIYIYIYILLNFIIKSLNIILKKKKYFFYFY